MAKAASELVVFDLDGTLLNADSEISSSTQETLAALRARGIPYTVATGRARHGAADLLEGLGFDLPQAFKNGVLLWHPLEGSTATIITFAWRKSAPCWRPRGQRA